MHDRFSNFSTRVSHSLQNQSLSAYRIPMYRARRRAERGRVGATRTVGEQAAVNRLSVDASLQTVTKHTAAKSVPKHDSHPPPRRKLLSIVKADGSLSVNSTHSHPEDAETQNSNSKLNEKSGSPHDLLVNISNASNSSREVTENAQGSVLNSSSSRQLFNAPPAAFDNSLKNGTLGSDSQYDGVADVGLRLSLGKAIVSILVAVSSPLAGRLATDVFDRLISELGDAPCFITLVFCMCTMVMFIFSIVCSIILHVSLQLHAGLNLHVVASGFLLGICLFVAPTFARFYLAGFFRRSQHVRPPKNGPSTFFSVDFFSLLDFPTCIPDSLWLCTVTLLTSFLNYLLNWTSSNKAESFSWLSALCAFLLFLASRLEAFHGGIRARREPSLSRLRSGLASSRVALPLSVLKRLSDCGKLLSRSIRLVRDVFRNTFAAMSDLGAHARTNRASWQVLNFLVLQSGMAVVEVIYASATHATGLFSISADNLFCSIALAVGLLGIRMSTWKQSAGFTYGFSRVESVCGFVNGVMLIFVALLIVLEAFERVAVGRHAALGRAFVVCLIGIFGNALGLYFFPPETRRENHNVQGIYLHIVANTLAFTSVAVSTAVTAVVPEWRAVDIAMAGVVALGVVAAAIPLIVRSGRLLLLMVPREFVMGLQLVDDRLRAIDGVCSVSSLRVWNLSPNCVIASVKLEIERDDELYDDVLAEARAVFAMMGIASSQCTIQISRFDVGTVAV